MNKRCFKWIDILIFTLLAVISEYFGSKMAGGNTGFYASFSSLISFILMIRWGWIGVIPYLLSGIVVFILSFNPNIILISTFYNVIANGFICIPFIFFFRKNRDLITCNYRTSLLMLLSCFICLSVGKGLCIFIIDNDILGFYNYYVSSLLIIVIDLIILGLLLRGKSEIIRDMDQYLIECQTREEI